MIYYTQIRAMRSSNLVLLLLAPAVLVAQTSTINTFAGNGQPGFSGDSGAATAASLSLPVFVATDVAGNVYIADQNNNRIRKVDTKGIITTIAGTGTQGFSGDGGLAVNAELFLPTGVFADGLGNIFIADVGNQRIRKIDSSGNITTVAGSGVKGYGGDGALATSAAFFNPVRAVVDNTGQIFIADQSNHRVRKVDTKGIVTTIAGTGSQGFSGDGGLATAAALNNPTGVALDVHGNLFIADQFNQRIRKVDASGIITTVAGNGAAGFGGDGGPALSASLNYPGGLIVDTSGNIFFADDLNFRVREASAAGNVTTVAGNGVQGFSGDGGAATAASLNGQFGVALDTSGNLLIADSVNNRIRIVSGASPVTPVFPSIAVTSAASYQSGGSAGAIGAIFGLHLSTNLEGVKVATVTPLPTNLGGTSVTVNGIPAPLFAVVNTAGQEQINFQIPWEVSGQSTVSIVVNNGVASNAGVNVPLSIAQPGVFLIDGVNGAIEHLDGTLVSTASPAAPGEYVVVFADGLGPVSPSVVTGQPTPPSPLSNAATTPTVTIGGLSANVVFSGEAPYFVALNQINVQVPPNAPSGSLDLIVSSNGVTSPPARIAVK